MKAAGADGFKLGLALYDGAKYAPALDAFARATAAGRTFGGLAWQGMVLDLLGRRAEALARYREALAVEGTPSLSHGQYDLTVDKAFIRARLATPFRR